MTAARTPPSFAVTVPTMTSKRRAQQRPARPVFLPAAVRRTARQPTWRKRLRSTRTIAAFLLDDVVWWLRNGLWHVPRTLSLARSRTTISIHDNIPLPAVDVYIPPAHDAYLRARLATVSCTQSQESREPPPVPSEPVVVYVHGGAWGSGTASHYSQLAHALTERTGATVLVLSYRLYPSARMIHQAADVSAALRYARRLFPHRKLVILAHSSGAHLTALALLREAAETSPLADVAIFTAGPFHLMHHFLFESSRGVAEVSPMLPGACAEDDVSQFDDRSPSVLAERFEGVLREVDKLPPGPPALEGEVAAANVHLPNASAKKPDGRVAAFPRTYIMTSSCDVTVPMYSSLRFATALRAIGLDCKLLVYDFTHHIDFITDWFSNATSRDRSDVLDVGEEDQKRRERCVEFLSGRAYVGLSTGSQLDLGPTPYVRDIVRILKSLSVEDQKDPSETV